MQTRAGLRLRGTTCSTEVVVVRPAPAPIVLTCCGGELTAADDTEAVTATGEAGVLLGKRYADEETGLELLCTKAGPGELAVDGRALVLKGTKPLPSSD